MMDLKKVSASTERKEGKEAGQERKNDLGSMPVPPGPKVRNNKRKRAEDYNAFLAQNLPLQQKSRHKTKEKFKEPPGDGELACSTVQLQARITEETTL